MLGRFGVLAGDYEWFVRDTRRGLRTVLGVQCLAGSNSPISVISRVMGRGIYIAFY